MLLTSEQLQKIIDMIDSYLYTPTNKMNIILKSPITEDNIYKRFELLNTLYPIQYTDKQYEQYLTFIFNNINFDVDVNLINIPFITTILKNIYAEITTIEGLYVYSILLDKYNLLTSSKIKYLTKKLQNTKYQDKFFIVILDNLITDESEKKTIINVFKQFYLNNTLL